MKAVTEFPNHLLVNGIHARTTLSAEGKTPEEVQANLGVTFKYEGDKLKYFLNALDVAAKTPHELARVKVMSLNEGENPPPHGLKVEELYYVPEFRIVYDVANSSHQKQNSKGGRGKGRQGGRGNDRGMKEGPWGLSPEQKAAKKGKGPMKGTGGGAK